MLLQILNTCTGVHLSKWSICHQPCPLNFILNLWDRQLDNYILWDIKQLNHSLIILIQLPKWVKKNGPSPQKLTYCHFVLVGYWILLLLLKLCSLYCVCHCCYNKSGWWVLFLLTAAVKWSFKLTEGHKMLTKSDVQPFTVWHQSNATQIETGCLIYNFLN